MKCRLLLGLLICLSPLVATATKVAVLSTSFVLEHKFKLMEATARDQDLDLAWTQVDREGETGVSRVLNGAAFVIIDAPNNEAISQVGQVAGEQLRTLTIPVLSVHRFNPSLRMQAQRMEEEQARQLFTYYISGTHVNRERMMHYLKTWLTGEDVSAAAPPIELPDSGIYHPDAEQMVFASLPEYLDWWQQRHNQPWRDNPIIGMETASSYLSDGQTRQLDETIAAIERAEGVPLIFTGPAVLVPDQPPVPRNRMSNRVEDLREKCRETYE